MSRVAWMLTGLLAGVAALAAPACGGETGPGEGDADTGPATLADQLTEAGLPPGNYRVESGGNAVCIRTYTYPGGGRVTEAIDLSGFSNFQLQVEDERIALRGTYDRLWSRFTEAACVEYDAGVDELENHTSCGADVECTPFSLVRLCANDGSPTFFARVPDCGFNTFPAALQ